ncbi:MAG: hypothetical protein J6Z01_08100 [Bacteroidales bacterium]|nr:hypothetical protein [Bacteroidales bacterium]
MNLNKPSRENILDKLTSYREQVNRLVNDPKSSTKDDYKDQIIYVDMLNEIIKKTDDNFRPVFHEQIRFKNIKLQSFLDKIMFIFIIPFAIIAFIVRIWSRGRSKGGFEGRYYADMVYEYAIYIMIGLGLLLFIKYIIIDKNFKKRFDSTFYRDHIDTMIVYIKTIPDEIFEQISFELAVKEL